MLGFIAENLSSIIIGAIVLLVIVLIIIKMIRGGTKSICSCGDCSSCGGCASCDIKTAVKKDVSANKQVD